MIPITQPDEQVGRKFSSKGQPKSQAKATCTSTYQAEKYQKYLEITKPRYLN
jgi:hypothetical protein